MPKRSSGHGQRKDADKLVEIAAEQLADLLLKHLLLKRGFHKVTVKARRVDEEAKKPIIKGEKSTEMCYRENPIRL